MKNQNYNLLKLLLSKLDDQWRITKHYLDDAEKTDCKDCVNAMKKVMANDKKSIALLKAELKKHVSRKEFD